MDDRNRNLPEWRDDVETRARVLDWPGAVCGGRGLDGQDAWRAVLTTAMPADLQQLERQLAVIEAERDRFQRWQRLDNARFGAPASSTESRDEDSVDVDGPSPSPSPSTRRELVDRAAALMNNGFAGDDDRAEFDRLLDEAEQLS